MKTSTHILHLTDIHLSPSGPFSQGVLLKAALDDVKSLAGSEISPDLVIVSGDLVQSADQNGSYDKFLDLLLKLASDLNITEERIILCPGNHDLSREVVGPRLPDVTRWRKQAETIDGSNKLYQDSVFSAYSYKAFSEFNALSANFSQSSMVSSGLGYHVYYFRDLGVAVVSINTALLSSGGLVGEGDDERKLVIAEALMESALSHVPDGAHIVVAGHHPTTWLNEQNADTTEAIFGKRVSMYLSGHLHAARPKHVFSITGSCFMGQSGALYQGRERWNGFAVYSIVPGEPHVKGVYRRWFEERREFSKAEDIANDGIVYSTPAAKEFFSRLRPWLDRSALEAWRIESLIPSIEGECNQCLSIVPLEDSFVPPEFIRETPSAKDVAERSGSKIENISFEKAISASANYLISASSQSGKTTTLRQWALSQARKSALSSDWTIPVIMDFSEARDYPAFMETLVSRKITSLPAGIKINDALERGLFTIFIDNFEFKTHGKAKAIAEFMAKHPTCRYILTTSDTIIDSSAWEPVIAPELPFTHLRLRALKRGQLLSLIQRNGVEDPREADQLLERVMREANSLNVPLTAVTGTFLIQVFTAEPNRVLVNQATLVERYIELLLQKFSRPDVELKSFDFRLKRDLLSDIASRMVKVGDYAPTFNTVLTWVLDYVQRYGFSQDASQIVEHFIVCRIWEKFEDAGETKIRFPLGTFLNYFVAWRMIEEPEFRSWILDPLRYLSYMDELSFYAALVRSDKSTLQFIFDEFERLSEAMWADASEEVKSGSFMDDFVEPNPEASEEELFAIQEVVRSNEDTDKERRHLLNDEVGSELTAPQVNRPEFETIGDKWYAHLLLTSNVLKHMELIEDKDKRRLLKRVITGWLQFCTFSLSLVPQIARDKTIKINGVLYKLIMASDAPMGEISRRLSLAMPIAVSYIATSQLGSEKLKLQLGEGIGDGLPPSEQLMRALLLADIGVDEVADILAAASNGVRESRYLTNVLARKMFDVAIRFRLDEKSLEKIRSLASDLLVKIEGYTHTRVGEKRKNEIVKSLRDQRLVSNLREKQ